MLKGIGSAGPLNPAYFHATAPHDANDHIIYNRTTAVLDYDANGNGAGGVTHLAVLSGHPVLTAIDFIVI